MRTVRLGAGMAFWGDRVQPAIEMVEKADIQYLCCDHLAELTMSILAKQMHKDPNLGYTRDILDLLRGAMRTCIRKGIKVITNSGGANPRACAAKIAELARELGLPNVKIAVVTGDNIFPEIDRLIHAGVSFANMNTGAPFHSIRNRLTGAAVYTGAEGIVEALRQGADIVVCGRVTDIALYLGPLIYEFGWARDDWQRLGMATAVAHCIECGGQATGGLYAGGDVDGLEDLGYPIAEVNEDGTAILTKTPNTGGRVDAGTMSEQLVYEILDPGNYLTADVTADFTNVSLEEVGKDRLRITGATGKPWPQTLKVNMGYRAGFIGETQFTYTWPNAYKKAQRGIAFLKERLRRADFKCEAEHIEYVGWNSMWGNRIGEPDDPDIQEIVVRYATRCLEASEARKVFTECVPLYNNGPAGVAGVGTRPPLKELYALWPCLVPREHVKQHVDMVLS
jgi:hypothetical protein